jgi:hypothetical protein
VDEVIAFVQDFIAREYEARRACCQPDRSVFEDKRREAESFFDQEAGSIGLDMAWNWASEKEDPDLAKALPQILARMRPDILFLVRRYRHPRWGDLYRAWVDGGTQRRRTSYLLSLFVARTPRGLRIIAKWGTCVTCRGTGVLDGEGCPECGGTGWEFAGGEQLGELGPVVEVRRLEAPTDPQSLADYERD